MTAKVFADNVSLITGSTDPDIATSPDTLRFVWGNSSKKGFCEFTEIETHNEVSSSLPYGMKIAGLPVSDNAVGADKLDLFISGKGATDTLIYDNGTPTHYYYWEAGNRMAMRMSPSSPCKILAVQIDCYKAQTYKVGLYEWGGSQPGNQLLETGNVTSTGQGWNTTDVSSSNINVSGDFIVSFNMIDASAAMGYDSTISSGRGWVYNGSSWSAISGTFLIRAIVQYAGEVKDTVKTLTVYNNGGTSLSVSNITDDQSWIVGITPTSFNVPAGNSQAVTVTVTRNGLGSGVYNGNLTISSNDPDEASYTEPIKFTVNIVGTEETGKSYVRSLSCGPNPFAKYVNIRYSIDSKNKVVLGLYDLSGRMVKSLVNTEQNAGSYSVDVNTKDLLNGIYFAKLETGNYKMVQKLVLVR